MHINRALFSKIRALFVYFQKGQGKPPTLPLSSCMAKLIQHKVFFHGNVQIQQKLTFDFKKPSPTWLVAAIFMQLIMAEST